MHWFDVEKFDADDCCYSLEVSGGQQLQDQLPCGMKFSRDLIFANFADSSRKNKQGWYFRAFVSYKTGSGFQTQSGTPTPKHGSRSAPPRPSNPSLDYWRSGKQCNGLPLTNCTTKCLSWRDQLTYVNYHRENFPKSAVKSWDNGLRPQNGCTI